MSSDTTPLLVPLPQSSRQTAKKPPVWPLQENHSYNGGTPSVSVPLPAKCDRNERDGGVCCKELKGENERTLIDPDVVRDAYVSSSVATRLRHSFFTLRACRLYRVIGLSDGLTVPFALAAGLSSLGESRLVVLGGIAELIVCLSNFLPTRQ
jgi:hypothetical protein